jgi:hypothetical protein
MADWTASSGSKIRPYRSLTSPFIREYEESTCAATAVIVRGDVVTSDTVVTSGGLRLVRAPSSGGTTSAGDPISQLVQVGIKSLMGVALQNSTSDGSTTGLNSTGIGRSRLRYLSVCLATPGQEFLGYVKGADVASQQLVGLNRPLIFDSTLHTFFVASTNSTAALAAVQITEVPDYAVGDSGAFPVVFRFLSTNVSPAAGGITQ